MNLYNNLAKIIEENNLAPVTIDDRIKEIPTLRFDLLDYDIEGIREPVVYHVSVFFQQGIEKPYIKILIKTSVKQYDQLEFLKMVNTINRVATNMTYYIEKLESDFKQKYIARKGDISIVAEKYLDNFPSAENLYSEIMCMESEFKKNTKVFFKDKAFYHSAFFNWATDYVKGKGEKPYFTITESDTEELLSAWLPYGENTNCTSTVYISSLFGKNKPISPFLIEIVCPKNENENKYFVLSHAYVTYDNTDKENLEKILTLLNELDKSVEYSIDKDNIHAKYTFAEEDDEDFTPIIKIIEMQSKKIQLTFELYLSDYYDIPF